MPFKIFTFLAALICISFFTTGAVAADKKELLNVSYDPTREFYEEYNRWFAAEWKKKTAEEVTIRQSHGGSGKQARAVIDGLKADIVTLALAYDIDVIAEKTGKIPANWQQQFPNHSAPYTSTVVFLVRKGNPKQIKDWNSLIAPGIAVVMPNPKTSGGARWNYLAAWGYALETSENNEEKAKEFISKLYKNVPVLDAGARGATTTFVQRNIGDVLVTWEDEAYLAMNQMGKDKFEIIYPSLSVKAEPPVAVVSANAKEKGTEKLANSYLEGLYKEEAQMLAAKHFYRPSDAKILAKFKEQFPAVKLFTVDDMGGWKAVQKKHFDDGGVFDQIYTSK